MNIKESITDSDVKEMGLKCGLEIHQQLEGRKLFCRTPTLLRDDEPHYTITRFLRASAGESGEVDKAAAAEQKKQKYYIYQGYQDTTGLVELDEEPPAPASKQAIRASLQTAKLLGMDIVDQVRFMRKTVVNGSNTSGFQRTGLIALDGAVELDGKKFGINSLCLEEDSAKDVEKHADYTIYNLSRLGVPLLEIATEPDVATPQEAKVLAEHLGMVLRSLDNVKRGLGTIRQDVNVSIAKGLRVEIKGAQDLKLVPEYVKQEMLRQHNLLEIFSELTSRGAKVGDAMDVTDLLSKSESTIVKKGLEKNGIALVLPLYGYAGLLGQQIQAGRRFGSELSDYAKVMGVKGLFHSDELPNYGITQEEKDALIQNLSLGEGDGFVLIIEEKTKTTRAMEAVVNRLRELVLLKEVRVARPDGSTNYMRPMPGAARMYPETDIEPLVVDKEGIEVPQLLSERIEGLAKSFGIAPDIAKKLLRDGIDLEQLSAEYSKVKPAFIIDIFYSLPSIIKKKYDVEVVIDQFADTLLSKLNAGEITKDSLEDITLLLAQGKAVDWSAYAPLDATAIEGELREFLAPLKDRPMGAIMGQVMGKYRGKVDGKLLSELVTKILRE